MNKLNRKGFTLVELLATIVILGVIAAIAMVSIDKILDNSQITECENVLLSIKSAAKEYVSDNRFNLSNKNITKSLSELISGGFLSSPINDPFNREELDSSQLSKLKIYITLNDDYTYQNAEIKVDGKMVTCELEATGDVVRFPG